MSTQPKQSFASKMQELIDEWREQLSVEFVRLSMEECQQEFNRQPTEMEVVKIYFDKYEVVQDGCSECCNEPFCSHTSWYNVAQIPSRLYAYIQIQYFKDPLADHSFPEIRGYLRENCYCDQDDLEKDFKCIVDSNSQIKCWNHQDTILSIRAIIPV